MRFTAFLRGVNVGGHRKVPMAELREMATAVGLTDVSTLLQSGNLLFSSKSGARELEDELERALESHMRVVTSVEVRSQAELEAVEQRNPFKECARGSPKQLQVHFFRDALDEDEVAAVQANVKGSERMIAVGRELYVTYPDGIGTSTLDKASGWKRLSEGGTARNWNTLTKILVQL